MSVKAPLLTLKQRDYLLHLLDKSNPKTYSNGTESVKAAYNTTDDNTAAVISSKLLRRDNIQQSIELILAEQNGSIENRIATLVRVFEGQDTRKVREYVYKEVDGTRKRLLAKETVYEPTYTERLKAIDLLNKLSGDYQKVNDDLHNRREIIKEMRKKIMPELEKRGKDYLQEQEEKQVTDGPVDSSVLNEKAPTTRAEGEELQQQPEDTEEAIQEECEGTGLSGEPG